MVRPNVKDYFGEDATLNYVHNKYINGTEMYNYMTALDRYIDYLESNQCNPQQDCLD